MIIRLKKAGDIMVYDNYDDYVGNVTMQELLKLARKKGKTTVKIDNDLRLELDGVFGDNTSMNDVIRHLKQEYDKNKV